MTVSPIDSGTTKFNQVTEHEDVGELTELLHELGGVTLREVMQMVEATADPLQRIQQMGHIAGLLLFLRESSSATEQADVTSITDRVEEPDLSLVEEVVKDEVTKNLDEGYPPRQAKYLEKLFGEQSAQLKLDDTSAVVDAIIELKFMKDGSYRAGTDLDRNRQIFTRYLNGIDDEAIAKEFSVKKIGLGVRRSTIAKNINETHSLNDRLSVLSKWLKRELISEEVVPEEDSNSVAQEPEIVISPNELHKDAIDITRGELLKNVKLAKYKDDAVESFEKLVSAQDTNAKREDLDPGRKIMFSMISDYIITHEDDYDSLPPSVRQALQKMSGFNLKQNAFPQTLYQVLRFSPETNKQEYEKSILTALKVMSKNIEPRSDMIKTTKQPTSMTYPSQHETLTSAERPTPQAQIDLFEVGLKPNRAKTENVQDATVAMFEHARANGLMRSDAIDYLQLRLDDSNLQFVGETRDALKALAALVSAHPGRLVETDAANMRDILIMFCKSELTISHIRQRVENTPQWKHRNVRSEHVMPMLVGAMSEVFRQTEKSRNR